MPKLVDVGGETFYVDDRGAGPALLLAHGFPLDHRMWQPQLDELADVARLIAPDLRGFGRSVVSPGTVTMEQMADDCARLLATLDVRHPVVFCGLSMGGYVAWQFARRHADRLRGLVLCDTRAVADTPEGAATRRKMARHVLEHGTAAVADAMLPKLLHAATAERMPGLVAGLREMIQAAPPEGVAAAQSGMAQRPDVTGQLAAISVPTLVLVGADDAISPPEEMRAVAEQIPGARFIEVPSAGHMAPLENPHVVNQALRAFLAGLPPLA